MLKGIKVIEFGRIFSAPLAGNILKDLNAEVIKIERKGYKDESRHYGMKLSDDLSDYYYALNSEKEVIYIDFKNEEDLKLVFKLIKESDVLIHNSIQSSYDKIGISYQNIKKLNPRLIYASINGYGNTDNKNTRSQDIVIQGLSGFMSLNGNEYDVPQKTGVPVIDYVTGQNLVIGILAALLEREKTNRGKEINCSLLESALSLIQVEATRYLNLDYCEKRKGNRHYSIAPYNSYKVKDGFIIIAIANDEMFFRLADLIGLDKEKFQTNEKRISKIDELEGKINEKLIKYPKKEILKLLKENNISAGPINDIKEAFDSTEVKDLKNIKKGQFKSIKLPINFYD
ncbi:CoA transferase [Acholeplasma sp. OttesenSCG-928-E16]|nr:CoA transferase [Acholeplasma sp. OttesenSCG-928-E16]